MLIPGNWRDLKPVDTLFHVGGRHSRGWYPVVYEYAGGPAFLERELVGLGVGGYW